MLIKVKDTTMMRDSHSLGLVETDKRKITEYKSKKRIAETATEAKSQNEELAEKVNTIEHDLKDTKALLEGLINGVR